MTSKVVANLNELVAELYKLLQLVFTHLVDLLLRTSNDLSYLDLDSVPEHLAIREVLLTKLLEVFCQLHVVLVSSEVLL